MRGAGFLTMIQFPATLFAGTGSAEDEGLLLLILAAFLAAAAGGMHLFGILRKAALHFFDTLVSRNDFILS